LKFSRYWTTMRIKMLQQTQWLTDLETLRKMTKILDESIWQPQLLLLLFNKYWMHWLIRCLAVFVDTFHCQR
jgi:hypothetical protein